MLVCMLVQLMRGQLCKLEQSCIYSDQSTAACMPRCIQLCNDTARFEITDKGDKGNAPAAAPVAAGVKAQPSSKYQVSVRLEVHAFHLNQS